VHCVLLECTCLHANLGSSASGTEVTLKALILLVLCLAGTLGTVVLGLAQIEVLNVARFEVCVVPSVSGHLEHGCRSCHERAILSFLALLCLVHGCHAWVWAVVLRLTALAHVDVCQTYAV
jgi:hypothetical protein